MEDLESRARKAWFDNPGIGEASRIDFAVYFVKKELEDLKKQLREETRHPSQHAKLVQTLVDEQGRIHKDKFVKASWVQDIITGRK